MSEHEFCAFAGIIGGICVGLIWGLVLHRSGFYDKYYPTEEEK